MRESILVKASGLEVFVIESGPKAALSGAYYKATIMPNKRILFTTHDGEKWIATAAIPFQLIKLVFEDLLDKAESLSEAQTAMDAG